MRARAADLVLGNAQDSSVFPSPGRSSLPLNFGIAAVLALTVAVYLPSLGFTFVHDDTLQVVTNPWITSWRFLGSYFGPSLWRLGWSSGVYYRPLFMAWLLVNRSLFGLNPQFWHLTSVLLHLLVTILVYRLITGLARDASAAVLGTLIFALHPTHIEDVAWVSGVPEPLMAVFFLAAILFLLRYRQHELRIDLALSLFCFALSLLAKETALAFPAVVVAYEYFIGTAALKEGFAQRAWLAIKRASPFAGLAVFYLALRMAVLRGFAAYAQVPWPFVFKTIPYALFFYLRHLLWPVGLSLFYDFHYVTTLSLRDFWFPALVLGLAAILLWVISRRLKPGVAAFASWWILLTLAPALNFRGFQWQEIAHDRYLYLPSVGFAIVLGIALATGMIRVARLPKIAFTAILAAALSAGVVAQIGPWASPLLLYYHAAQVAPADVAPVSLLAAEEVQRGMFPQAADLYLRVTQLAPNWSAGWYGLGAVRYRQQQYQSAEPYLARAAELEPSNADVLYVLGLARMQMQRWDDASAALRAAVALRPQAANFQAALHQAEQRRTAASVPSRKSFEGR